MYMYLYITNFQRVLYLSDKYNIIIKRQRELFKFFGKKQKTAQTFKILLKTFVFHFLLYFHRLVIKIN